MDKYKYFYCKGDELYSNGNFIEALKFFKKAFSINETYACADYIGCCYLQLNGLERAEEMFDNIIHQAVIDGIQWEKPFIGLARICMKKEKYDKALEYLRQAETINSNSSDLYFYYGILYKKQKDYRNAIISNFKSLECDSEQPDIYLNLSDCYYHINEYKKALQCCENAMKNPDYANDALYNKGRVLIAMKRYKEAKEEFLKINTTDAEFLKEIEADILYCSKQIEIV